MFPTVAQYHYLLGVALMQAGDMLAAVDPLREAERLEPDRAAHARRARARAQQPEDVGEAKPAAPARASNCEPDNVEAMAALAEAEEGLDELGRRQRTQRVRSRRRPGIRPRTSWLGWCG